MIIVDVHEPKSVLSLLKRKGLDFERNFLEVGDYILPDGIAIERKRGDDFLHSIIDGRLWVQANNLTQYDVPIFCVVSNNMWKDMYFNKSRHIHKAYYGALATLISKFSIPTVNFSSDEDFVDFICYLYSKILSDKKSTRPVPLCRKPKSLSERRENCLAMIEGVSISKAKQLLDCFGSIRNISNADIDELMKSPGIGRKLAQNIHETLN